MTNPKPLSKRSAPMENFGNVDYLSAVDVRDETLELTAPGFCTVTFDAIPRKILPFLRRANSQQIAKQSDSALSFLLMEAVVPTSVFEQEMRNGDWCSITVSENPSTEEGFYKATALEFSEQAQESVPMTLYVKINTPSPDTKDLQALKRVIECRHHQSAAFDYLGIQPKENLFVAVYDVGQANMCAIIDDDCKPKAFFDFGWPIGPFRRSIPSCRGFAPLTRDDPSHPAPVFLSHLDWDHWGYAYASGRPIKDARGFWKTHVTYRPDALKRPWVMRRPSARMKLGISHAHLLYALQNQMLQDGSSALKFWPTARAQIQWGACILFACNPAPGKHDAKYLRNNEALGMLIENPQSSYYRRVLLCGDADYTSIATRFKRSLGGIVAPHHGGEVKPHSIPVPDVNAGIYRYMVFSTHEGCYSKIPSIVTITEATKLGWKISRTDERQQCCCGPGERRNRWFSLANSPSPRHCGGCCCLI